MEGCHLGDPTSMQGEDRRPAARRRGALSRAELEEIRTKAAEMVGGEVYHPPPGHIEEQGEIEMCELESRCIVLQNTVKAFGCDPW